MTSSQVSFFPSFSEKARVLIVRPIAPCRLKVGVTRNCSTGNMDFLKFAGFGKKDPTRRWRSNHGLIQEVPCRGIRTLYLSKEERRIPRSRGTTRVARATIQCRWAVSKATRHLVTPVSSGGAGVPAMRLRTNPGFSRTYPPDPPLDLTLSPPSSTPNLE